MKVNKIIAGVMAVCFMGFGVPYVNAVAENNSAITASAKEFTVDKYEQLTYKNYGDYIEIAGCNKSVTEVVIPAEIEGVPVTSIEYDAFHSCSKLTSVTIPDSITSIGYGAFLSCRSLKSIEIPESVTSIGERAFFKCSSLTSIKISGSITSIGYYAFHDCSSLKSIEIPDSVTSIGDSAFSCCGSLTSIEIPDSVTSIGYYAFYDCSSLTSITILNPDCDIYDYKETISETTTIYGYENSTAQAYAEKYNINFVSLGTSPEKETITGDMNGDNSVNMADAVLLQKCILGSETLTKEQFDVADINSDGFVDSFDMVLLRRELIENNK